MRKLSILKRSVRNLACAVTVITAALFLTGNKVEAATLGPWSLSGPGTTSVSGTDASPTFNYSVDPAGYGTVTWTASATVLSSGFYNFDWNYSGFHAFFDVTAFLNTTSPAASLVAAGPEGCCTAPSSGFNYSGTTGFAVTAGDTIGFTFGGSNFDTNNVLSGTLTITEIPVPAAGLMLISALAGAGAVTRRRKAMAA